MSSVSTTLKKFTETCYTVYGQAKTYVEVLYYVHIYVRIKTYVEVLYYVHIHTYEDTYGCKCLHDGFVLTLWIHNPVINW